MMIPKICICIDGHVANLLRVRGNSRRVYMEQQLPSLLFQIRGLRLIPILLVCD